MSFALSSHATPNKLFLIQRSELEGRLDPNTYHPLRMQAIQRLEEGKYPVKRLGSITPFTKEITTSISDQDTYIGLENVEGDTGVYVTSSQKEKMSSALIFEAGQVLFPKLRPYLNKVFYADFGGICSTEFHVLDSAEVDNKYLASFLRLNIVVTQTTLLMSGNTLPRLQTEDIKSLLVPIPPPKKCRKKSLQRWMLLTLPKSRRRRKPRGCWRALTTTCLPSLASPCRPNQKTPPRTASSPAA